MAGAGGWPEAGGQDVSGYHGGSGSRHTNARDLGAKTPPVSNSLSQVISEPHTLAASPTWA
jgi:hypothetical protein